MGAGLHAVLVTTSVGTQRQLHLREHRAETATWGPNPALDAWRADGLVATWDPRRAGAAGDGPVGRPLDRSLMVLALALFLCGVLVDRAPIPAFVRR